VISQILSNGKAGLIDLNLNKKQQVLGAGSGVNNWKACSFFTLSGRAKSGQSLEEVKDLLLGQLALIREGRFDERLLKAIVSNFKLGELEGLENNNNRAVSLMDGFIVHRGEHWKEEVSFVEDMGKVTKQDIVSFANRYLNSNYVLVYKRKGEDKNEVKVEKPPITPVEVNKDAQSPFLKKIAAMPVTDIKPQWLDYKKDIQHAKMGTADLLYVRNTDNDIFRLYYRFDMGAWNNRLFPLAAAYLQYLGTTEYSAAQVSQQFYNLACNFSVKPGNDVSQVVISGLQENFDKAVQAFEDLLEHCQADEAALQNLKARIRKSRADSKLNKENISGAMVQYAIYGARNPFNYQLSNEELDAVTSEQLLELLHQLFHYKHTIIYYGPELPADFTPVPAPARFEKADLTVNKVLFTDYDMVQAEVNWVHNTRPYDIAQAPVIDLFNSYFGGGMGSVVFQTIRESKALAYSTYAFYSSPNKKEDKYTVVAYVGSQADKMEEAVAGMNELLDSLPRTEQALERAKQSIKQDIATQRITQDGIIFSWLNVSRLGQDTDIRKRVYDAIDQLRFEDIQRFHQLYVAHQPYVYCVLGSAKKINLDDLKKIGVVQQLSLEQLFGY
jgi:predicted Zn-dependent peptidase